MLLLQFLFLRYGSSSFRAVFFLIFLFFNSSCVNAIPKQHPHFLASLPIDPRSLGASRLGLRRSNKCTSVCSNYERKDKQFMLGTSKSSHTEESESYEPEQPRSTVEIYRSLNPIGKCVAGTIEVGFRTVLEYMSGFTGGYLLASMTDLPRFVLEPINPKQPFLPELGQRYARMHSRSFRWAKTSGGIFAVFGGCRVASKVVRGGKEDEWNSVLSAATAGAFFARNQGPQGMVRGALMYGGIMYFLAGGMGQKQEPFDYDDEPFDY